MLLTSSQQPHHHHGNNNNNNNNSRGGGGGGGGRGGNKSSQPSSTTNITNNTNTTTLHMPDYIRDKETIKQFLLQYATTTTISNQTSSIGGNDDNGSIELVYPYKKLIEDLKLLSLEYSDEKLKFIIQFDDLLIGGYKDLISKIHENGLRFKKLFENVIDQLIQQDHSGGDDDTTNMNMNNNIPSELNRKYELTFQQLSTNNSNNRNITSNNRNITSNYGIIPLRQIKGKHIGKLVTVRGIVTKQSDVKAEMKVASYKCDTCSGMIYQTINQNSFIPIESCVQQECKGNLLQQTRESCFVKFQQLVIQEMSDEVPTGHIPRTMRVVMRGELTRTCTPGDSITCFGIFLPYQVNKNGNHNGPVATTYLEAHSILKHKRRYTDLSELSQQEEALMTKIDQDISKMGHEKWYDKLSNSIAPEIYGHLNVKKALLLMLIGAQTREMKGLKIRGDLNVILMGDPGVAKSQLLRFISHISPRGIYTTGKGSSGVGLTAAIVKDPLTNELILEGGALVLADNGICCIDEFDKMEEYDRTALHEVMEQQSVSIAKAGITTTLNARTCVLAAANPAYGRWNTKRSVTENINLPPALMSRFDLMFLLLDKQNNEMDMNLARHITHVHQFSTRPPSTFINGNTSNGNNSSNSNNGNTSNGNGNNSNTSNNTGNNEEEDELFSPEYIRAVVTRAKSLEPCLSAAEGFSSNSASNKILDIYITMRQNDERNSKVSDKIQMYTTPRTILSIYRLSEAKARLRFSSHISISDVCEAERLILASRSSLLDDTDRNQRRSDPMYGVYDIIRNRLQQSKDGIVDLVGLQSELVGFRQEDISRCLNYFEELNIWMTTDTTVQLVKSL